VNKQTSSPVGDTANQHNKSPCHLVTLSPCHPVIFLIGPRGSGKTTVARTLADRLGWEWCDADELLERRHRTTIREIFEAEGEAGFRDREAAVLADLVGQTFLSASDEGQTEMSAPRGRVVATGGGVVLREENRARLRQAGWVVYLAADVATLAQRLRQDATTAERRPALTSSGATATAEEEITAILTVREPLYRACADCVVQTAGRAPEEIVAEIVAAWEASRRNTS
jgi:shikimate kinase